MASDDFTENNYAATSTIMHETMARLRELVDEGRRLRALKVSDADHGARRQAFIDWSEQTSMARGFLECLVTLNLLREEDEIAWYEYLGGECDTAPETEI